MRGAPPQSHELVPPEALPADVSGVAEALDRGRVLPHKLPIPWSTEFIVSGRTLWMIISVKPGFLLGFRLIQDGVELFDATLASSDSQGLRIRAKGGNGQYECQVSITERGSSDVRYKTTLTPREALLMSAWAPEICVLDASRRPLRRPGKLFTVQTGPTAGQLFLEAQGRQGGGLLYFQNLSALRPYSEQTGASLAGSVHLQWPVGGFALPAGEKPLAPRRKVVISDAFISVRDHQVANEVEAGKQFIDFLAAIYPLLDHPPTTYQDWPDLARQSLSSLQKDKVTSRRVKKRFFIQAYVGSVEKPPESMVQGALAVPLAEYEMWRGRPVPLLELLRHYPKTFYNARLRIPVRWLLGVPFDKPEKSEEEAHYRMDSWYLLHTLLNIGRLAEMGDTEARKVFLDSVPTLIKVAQHFDYNWPVFYDQRTLTVLKEETAKGEGGEQDACGLYTKVMLQAYDFTHEQQFVDEARRSAEKLVGLGFGVLYQSNTSALCAVAMVRLWKVTQAMIFRDLSLLCMSSILSHLWLWEGEQPSMTYMALPPLHDAPYIAFYEEAEILACFQTWLKELGDEVPHSASLLIAEYQKYLLSRAHYYYPSFLPPDRVTQEPKEGYLSPRLLIPLEGLGPPGEKAGTVGQAVYAAGAPFLLTTHCWHRLQGVPFLVFCEYPVLRLERQGRRSGGKVRLWVSGRPQLAAALRLIRVGGKAPPPSLYIDGSEARWKSTSPHHFAMVAGGSEIVIEW